MLQFCSHLHSLQAWLAATCVQGSKRWGNVYFSWLQYIFLLVLFTYTYNGRVTVDKHLIIIIIPIPPPPPFLTACVWNKLHDYQVFACFFPCRIPIYGKCTLLLLLLQFTSLVQCMYHTQNSGTQFQKMSRLHSVPAKRCALSWSFWIRVLWVPCTAVGHCLRARTSISFCLQT